MDAGGTKAKGGSPERGRNCYQIATRKRTFDQAAEICVEGRRIAAWLTGSAVRDPPPQKKRDGLVSNSFFSGLGVKRFSDLLIEGVAFAFGREPSVFGLDIGFAFL